MTEERTSQGLPTSEQTPKVALLTKPALDVSGLGYASRTLARGLTPQRIAGIFDNASQYIAEQIDLAAQMEESDDHLNGTLELRRAAVLRLEANIEAGDADDELSVQAAEAARSITAAPWFYALRDWLLRAIFQQWTAAELFYEERAVTVAKSEDGGSRPTLQNTATKRTLWMPKGFRAVEPCRWFFERDAAPKFYISATGAGETIEPLAGKFAVHSYSAVYGQPGRYAKVRALAKLWFLAQLDLTGWGAMVDNWAAPFTVFQYREGMSAAEIQTVINTFITLAANKAAAIPEGVNLTLHDVPTQEPHEKFQDFVRRAMSRFILGQDSSQTAVEGQKTGATLQGNVRDDIRDMDAQLLDASLNETLLAPWCAWNFGPEVAAPRICHRIREEQDPEQLGRVLSVAQTLGMPVPAEWAYQALGIEMPADAPAVLFGNGAGRIANSEVNPGGAANNGGSRPTLQDQSAVEDPQMKFLRQLLLTWIQDGTVSDVVYNATDIIDLLNRLGLKVEKGYEAPWIPVQTPDGGTVTGDVVKDPAGDVVGGVSTPPPTPTTPPGGGFPGAGFSAFAAGGTVTIASVFEPVLNAVRSAAEKAASFEEFQAALPKLIAANDGASAAEALQAATLASYAQGAVAMADELAKRKSGLEARTTQHGLEAHTTNSAHTTNGGSRPTLLAAGPEVTVTDAGPVLEKAPFEDAIAALKKRRDVLPRKLFDELATENQQRCFTVARIANIDVLNDLHDAAGQAVEQGQTYRDFVDSLNAIMEKRGWTGLAPWHAQLVFNQNMKMAHTAGRAAQADAAGAGYWRYLPSDALVPREEHKQYYGKIFRSGEGPMPPLDFGCNCDWEPVFGDEINAGDVADNAPSQAGQEFQWTPRDYFGELPLDLAKYPETFRSAIEGLIKSEPNLRLKVA